MRKQPLGQRMTETGGNPCGHPFSDPLANALFEFLDRVLDLEIKRLVVLPKGVGCSSNTEGVVVDEDEV